MFSALRASIAKFFRPSAIDTKDVDYLAARIAVMPGEPPPKGKRWCLNLNHEWVLVDVPKPDPARKKALKRKARA